MNYEHNVNYYLVIIYSEKNLLNDYDFLFQNSYYVTN